MLKIFHLLCKIAIALVFLGGFHQTFSQEYFKKFYKDNVSYGGYHTRHLKALDDGSYIRLRLAEANSTPHADTVYVEKYNYCGDLIWGSGFLVSFSLESLSLQLSPQGNPIVAASGQHDFQKYLLVYKLSADGQNLLWSRKYFNGQNIFLFQFDIASNGDLWLGIQANQTDIVVVRMDSAGGILHAGAYDQANTVAQRSFELLDTNSFLLTHETTVLKVDSIGSISWKTNYSDLVYIVGAVAVADGFLISGQVLANRTVIFKIDNRGYVKSSRNFAKNLWSQTIERQKDGSIWVFGHNEITDSSGNRATTPSVVRLDEHGNFKENLQIGIETMNLNHGHVTSVRLQNNSLLVDAIVSLFSNGSFHNSRMVGRMSLDQSKFFCGDTSNLVLSTLPAVDRIYKSPPPVANFILHDSALAMVPVAFHHPPITECFPTLTGIFRGDSLRLCTDDSVSFLRSGLNPLSVLWSTGDTTRSTFIDSSGLYWVSMTFPCDDQVYYDTLFVSFFPKPVHSLSVLPRKAEVNQAVRFNYVSQNSEANVTWNFGDGHTSTSAAPTHYYQRSGTYRVTMTITTEDGCEFDYHDSVKVLFQEFSIPNIFTPNGDGINDLMTVEGEEIEHYQLDIYNRSGVQVISLPNQAWDGTTRNGTPAAEGVYFYLLQYTLYDGTSAEKRGNVTLSRGRY